jgi:hypothetical protein
MGLALNQSTLKQLANGLSMRQLPKLDPHRPVKVFALVNLAMAFKTQCCNAVIMRF